MAAGMGVELGAVTTRRFADGEIFVRIDDNVRGRDLYIVQSTVPPADNIMELLLLLDAAQRASAARITAVIPYFGYARQDRKDQPRVAIGAKLVANLITSPARTGCSAWTSTSTSCRASSTSRWTTCTRRRCSPSTSATRTSPTW
jgi:ribose-phosphate pyrophosphokinase